MLKSLLRIRSRSLAHALQGLEPLERLRLLLLVLGLTFFGLWLASGLLQTTLVETPPAELPGQVRMEAYRAGLLLAAVVGLVSLEMLWRNRDLAVLAGLPIPPRVMLHYRLISIGLTLLPAYLLTLAAFLRLLPAGEFGLALEVFLTLTLTYGSSLVCALAWHIFAAQSIDAPSLDGLKEALKGKMVLAERTFLLYSPMLAAGTGFLAGFLLQIALSALTRGTILPSLLGLACALAVPLVAYRQARIRFEGSYYGALASLADGEYAGRLKDARTDSSFVGQFFSRQMPRGLRPLVIRDLRQAWRCSRLDFLLLWTSAVVGVLYARGKGLELLATGRLWPILWGLTAAASWQGLRLTRTGCDAPILWWLSPLPFSRQLLARCASSFFFPHMILPALWGMAWLSGASWGSALAILAGLAIGSAVLAASLSLRFITRKILGATLYWAGVGVPLAVFPARPALAVGLVGLTALLATLDLRGLERRVQLDAAGDPGPTV